MPYSGLTLQSVLIRMTAALVMGGVIGFEREAHERPAGLRTHMLISLAACLFTLIALELISMPEPVGDEGRLRIDPLRLIEAVTAGVAFLAAGSIITSGGKIKGLTTGASMWLAGAIGLASGSGNLALGGIAVVLALIVLAVLRWMKHLLGWED
ncbi:MgtC/SapB family protein [Halovulum marinum]|nr:MgtC/SapB family protein [Halovulum marinum]